VNDYCAPFYNGNVGSQIAIIGYWMNLYYKSSRYGNIRMYLKDCIGFKFEYIYFLPFSLCTQEVTEF
jgi:hypothetical protein